MLSADDSLHCNSKGYKGISFIGDIKYRNALLHTFLNRLMLTQTLKQRLIKLKHNMKTVEEALLLWGLNYFTLMMTNSLYCHRYKPGHYLLPPPKTSCWRDTSSLAGWLSHVCQRHSVHCSCLSKWLLRLDWKIWLDEGKTQPLHGFYHPDLCHLWIKCCHLSGLCFPG